VGAFDVLPPVRSGDHDRRPEASKGGELSPPRPMPTATAQTGSVPSSRLARLAELFCTAQV
jgi:hypothetical protein